MARDAYKYFRIEASDIVDRLTQGLIRMREDGAAPAGGVRELLRLAHTLKGAAHVVNEAALATAAHALESKLSPHSGDAALPSDLAARMLVDVERLAELLSRSQQQRVPQPVAPESESERKLTFQTHAKQFDRPEMSIQQIDDVPRTVRVDLDEMDQLVQGVTESMVRFAALRSSAASMERIVSLANALVLHIAGPSRRGEEQLTSRAIALADSLAATAGTAHRELASSIDQLERELTAVQEGTAHLRLTHTRSLFIALERAVVSAAEQLGKRVKFIATGGELRIDAQLLAAVRNPLLHIVRNAVAHGIELPSERLLKGKNEFGVVQLSVERRGSQVAFICGDDGGGIDMDRIRETAVQRGFLSREEARRASQEQLISLITKPGFTTEAAVNQVAGRGIGLDAVAAVVAHLNGSIKIETKAGEGTRLEISTPAALLVTEVVFAEVAASVVAIPAESIRETLRFSKGEVVTQQGRQHIIHNSLLVPYISLANLLGQGGHDGDVRVAVLVEHDGSQAAVGVDRLRGTGTLVSRPLPPFLMAEPFVSGVALDVEGTPELILDAAGLVRATLEHSVPGQAAVRHPLPVLVIDDSLTTRMLEQSILEAAGYEVDVAVSADEAMVKARRRDYGLFLVDVEMPGMNGFEFIEATREDEVLKNVPAVLVTSRSSAEDRARGSAVGASDYIVKSDFDQAYLLDRIRMLVRCA